MNWIFQIFSSCLTNTLRVLQCNLTFVNEKVNLIKLSDLLLLLSSLVGVVLLDYNNKFSVSYAVLLCKSAMCLNSNKIQIQSSFLHSIQASFTIREKADCNLPTASIAYMWYKWPILAELQTRWLIIPY